MSERDVEAFEFYEDPAHREPAPGPPRRRGDRALTQHVPVRFSANTIEEIKRLAVADGMTVSAWIRRAVTQALRDRTAIVFEPAAVSEHALVVFSRLRRDVDELAAALRDREQVEDAGGRNPSETRSAGAGSSANRGRQSRKHSPLRTERSSAEWWQDTSVREDLQWTLLHANEARDIADRPNQQISSAARFADAVDSLIAAYLRLVQQPNRRLSQTGAFAKLLTEALPPERQKWLLDDSAVLTLRHVTPLIRDEVLLSRRDYERDQPLPLDLRAEAEGSHGRFATAFDRHHQDGGSQAQIDALVTLARVLWMIRSNIDHGRKALGPRSERDRRRDLIVARATSRSLEAVLEAVLDFPSTRLAAYGTLAPGGRDHDLVADMGGNWSHGFVRGRMDKVGGLFGLRWKWDADLVPVHLLDSSTLPWFWEELDHYEGAGYRRSWVPVERRDGVAVVACLYERRTEPTVAGRRVRPTIGGERRHVARIAAYEETAAAESETSRANLDAWIVEALMERGGSATLVDVCRDVWDRHQSELEHAGDLFFTWQYDLRWAAHRLRRRNVIKAADKSPSGVWELAQHQG